MPIQPDLGAVHVNRPLTNISLAFMLDPSAFVADRAFPNIPVEYRSDTFYTFDRTFWLRDNMRKRGPGTESQGTGFEVATTPYLCDLFALHVDVSDIVRANADGAINMDRESTSLLVQQAMIKREKTWAARALVGASWTSTQTGVASASPGANQFTRWDFAGADPVAQILAWKRIVQITNFTGKRPNVLVIGQEVWDALLTNASIMDRLKYGQTQGRPAQVTMSAVAQLLELDEIIVGSSVEVTSAEGVTPVTAATIIGKKGLLFYRPSAPGMMTPSAGYTFSWRGYHGMTDMGHRIKKFRMEPIASDRIEVEMAYDQRVISADLGVFLDVMVS
jgi:hypothetical protein